MDSGGIWGCGQGVFVLLAMLACDPAPRPPPLRPPSPAHHVSGLCRQVEKASSPTLAHGHCPKLHLLQAGQARLCFLASYPGTCCTLL